jgi:hypothetical protein
MHAEGDFPEIKWPGSEADHSPASSVKVKNGGALPPLPYMSPRNYKAELINHRVNFMFFRCDEILGMLGLILDRLYGLVVRVPGC